jgi:hypothetical protein
MENTYPRADELAIALWHVSERLNEHHKKMMEKIIKATNDLRTNNYAKKSENDYIGHGLWDCDGKGEPCVRSDEIEGWTDCQLMLEEFSEEYQLGTSGTKP